jgi:uncharacterized repeat protein (TIGR01451 family)
MTHFTSRGQSSVAKALSLFMGLCLIGLLFTCGTPLFAAAPQAGTSIGNQASATYTDGSGQTRTATSNPVYTIVQQIGAVSLTSGVTDYATAGSSVVFPHTVTNTGNGTDSFSLAAANAAGNFNFSSVAIYANVSGNGVPDNTTPITSTPAIAPGAVYHFVVVVSVPTTAVSGNNGSINVTAASVFDATKTVTQSDTATVTSNAVVNVTKAISINAGQSPTTGVTYTLTYKNNGNATATSLTLTDVIPTGMTYVAGSGMWSGSTTALTDASGPGNDPAGINYQFDSTALTVTAVIANVSAGGTGTVTFRVNVNAGLPTQIINNTALFNYNNGTTVVNASTNPVAFTVTQAAGVTYTGATVATAQQGSTVTFSNLVTNTGNGPDTFNITQVSNTFPAGTTFVFYQADGSTPLMDSNNDGIPDTGLLQPGGTYNVIVKATLPPGTAGGPYTFLSKATSTFDPSQSATATDTLTAINPATVDLTNNGAGAGNPGFGAGPEGTPQVTNTTNPGTVTRFTLYVNNTSAIGDTYVMQASTDSTFNTLALPAGWSVIFRDSTGAILSNTGIIASGANKEIFADVTVAATAAPGNTELFFRVSSPATNANDRLHDRIAVNTVRGFTLVPRNTGQLYAGNSVVYTHVITNTGNVLEGDNVSSTISLATVDSGTGFTSVIYWDKNNNGTLDPNDVVISDLSQLTGGSNGANTAPGLLPGQSATLFVKVYAPAGATAGVTDTCNLTAHDTGTISGVIAPPDVTVTDNSTIIAGNLQIQKWQAPNVSGNGTPDSAYTTVNINANPGTCIRYKIVVTNLGTADATNVVISDATPNFTTYAVGSNDLTPTGVACYTMDGTTFQAATTAPAAGAAGTITVNLGATPLKANQSLTIYFGVQVNH